jgi:dihydroflavonol-4-reductase
MILVTGATGHIGNVLVRTLLGSGEQVRALVAPGENTTPLDGQPVEIQVGDVLDYPALEKTFQGVDTVYHLAGMISILPGRNPLLQAVNVLGTRNVLQAARSAGVRRLVYTSSIHALQRIPHGAVVDAAVPFDPEHAISAYDHSKATASLEVINAARSGLNAVIVCPTGVIGPHDYRGSEMGRLILDCVRRRPILYIEGAYDFVDVRDVAQGLMLAAEKGQAGRSYILSGERIRVPDLVQLIQQIAGKGLFSLRVPLWLARMAADFAPQFDRWFQIRPRITTYSIETLLSNSIISHARASTELGYAPRALRDSVADTVRWFVQRKIQRLPAGS